MDTKVFNSTHLNEIIKCINEGEIVAFPTDTVYGLAIRYDIENAIDKMVEVKGRPEGKPFALLVSSIKHIEKVARLTPRDHLLIERLLPGAVTILFNKNDYIDDKYTFGKQTIAIRMLDKMVISEVVKKINVPLLLTSANISGMPDCTNSDQVLKEFKGKIGGIIDGVSYGDKPSTIIDASSEELRVIRQGTLTLDEVLERIK